METSNGQTLGLTLSTSGQPTLPQSTCQSSEIEYGLPFALLGTPQGSTTVRATRLIKRMRGSTQPHLVRADDGFAYVVKLANNPQGRRVLVNDWIGSALLRHLGIASPVAKIIEITREFLEGENVLLECQGHRFVPDVGLHFGSRYPGDPSKQAVFDFVANRDLEWCLNRSHFVGTLAFDKWVCNTDFRQAIFYRTAGRIEGFEWSTPCLVAEMIDNGLILGGCAWRFNDSPLQSAYSQSAAYSNIRGWKAFDQWIGKIQDLPTSILDDTFRSIPKEWMWGEEDILLDTLERLYRRRGRVPDLIEDLLVAKPGLFPDWQLAPSNRQPFVRSSPEG